MHFIFTFRNRLWLILVSLTLVSFSLAGQYPDQENDFSPKSGQEGKDVVWVPTPQILVEKMLDLAKVTSSDYLIDLGAGDGRLVIAAAKRGARALGVEYNPDMVELATENARKEGVSDKARFIEADLFETDLSEATVITLFLLTDLNVRLRPGLLELKPGTRVVSNTFSMQEWEADKTETVDDECGSWRTALLWIIPAKVNGRWRLDEGRELIFEQDFQMLSGELKSGKNKADINSGRLNGEEISFKVSNATYTGRVKGSRIEGTIITGGETKRWSATRY